MASTAKSAISGRDPSRRPPATIEQLAVEQGVPPVRDLDELSDLWPADDDPDALDAFIAEFRAGRREAARRKQSPGG